MSETIVQVECYSGFKADERPVRFVLVGRTFEVSSVEDKWYSPGETYFRVLASDGNHYVLRHEEAQDVWTLAGFRSARAEQAPMPPHSDPDANRPPS